MLENKQVSAPAFKGFGRRFGRVSGRFFAPKMNAKSQDAFFVQHQKTLCGRMNFEVRLLQQVSKFEQKLMKDEIFLDLDSMCAQGNKRLNYVYFELRKKKKKTFSYFDCVSKGEKGSPILLGRLDPPIPCS